MFDLIEDAELSACLGFVIKIDSLKGVLRKTSPIGMQRPENTAEHSWHLIINLPKIDAMTTVIG